METIKTVKLINHVYVSFGKQGAGSSQVNNSMQKLAENSQKIVGLSDSVVQTVNSISKNIEQLDEMMKFFKT